LSRDVAALVYSRQLGSMARKAVLAYMAERANDDGSGVWASKQRIADEVECSKQTVITTIKGLVDDGLVIETGHHKTTNGYTVVYGICIDVVGLLPAAKRDDKEVQILTGQELDGSRSFTPRGQGALPKPSLNRPVPSEAKASSGRATSVPSDFQPVMKPGSITAKAVDGWPPGELEEQIEHFIDRHTVMGTMSRSWQASWRTWVKNWKKFNGKRTGSADNRQSGSGRHRGGDGFIAALREAADHQAAYPPP
jgi:biotin operon repressor